MHRLLAYRALLRGVNHRYRRSAIRLISEFPAAAACYPARCVGDTAASSKALVPLRPYATLAKGDYGTFFLRAQSPEDLFRLTQEAIACSTAVVSRLLERSVKERLSAKELVYAIDHISNTLCLLADPCELLRHVHPSKAWRHAANTTVEEISALISRLNIDEKLYAIMNDAYETSSDCMSDEESLVFLHMIESMRHQGVGLPPSDREAYLDLQREEALISFELSDNEVLKHLTVTSIYGFKVPHSSAAYSYILRNSPDEGVRRMVWEAQVQSNPDVLDKLLCLRSIRNSIACTRGFRNYAECAQRECIMNNPEAVDTFLNKCASSIKNEVMAELSELRYLKRSKSSKDVSLNPWDLDYLIGSDRGKLSVEFSVRSVIDYFEKLLYELFGIKLVRDTTEPLWHPLVAKFILVRSVSSDVNEESFVEPSSSDNCIDGNITGCESSVDVEIAHLYMDLFSREGKANVCAQFTVRCSKLIEPICDSSSAYNNASSSGSGVSDSVSSPHVSVGSPDGSLRQIPATTIVCSFPIEGAYSDISEALNKSYIDVMAAQTLFHELGHTVHALCSRTTLQHLSGNRGGVDFAVFSSHLFELYFVEGLPEICKSAGLDKASAEKAATLLRKYRAIDTARMALMAKLDLRFYNSCEELQERNIPDLINSVRLFDEKFDRYDVSVLLGLPALTNFDHLIHYGGTYFCYLYSRVLAIKIWKSFEGQSRSRSTGDKLYSFFMKGSTDASLAPLNILAGRDLTLMKDDLFLD